MTIEQETKQILGTRKFRALRCVAGTLASMIGKSDCSLNMYATTPNRRAHEAPSFPIHPAHDSNRFDHGVTSWYVVGTVTEYAIGIVVG